MCYTAWMNPDTKGHMLQDYIYMKHPKWVNQTTVGLGMGKKEMGSDCLEPGVPFGVMKTYSNQSEAMVAH